MQYKTKKDKVKHEIRLEKEADEGNESIESLRAKMDNIKENPEEGLQAAIEVLRRFGHRRGWTSR
ncbi:MAG: hypothetical protein ACSNEK_02735 [Parachlamydiaceae bacterium]